LCPIDSFLGYYNTWQDSIPHRLRQQRPKNVLPSPFGAFRRVEAWRDRLLASGRRRERRGGDFNDVIIALRLVQQLERVPCAANSLTAHPRRLRVADEIRAASGAG
jgi:hypothetical protein